MLPVNIKSLLAIPRLYDIFQSLIGGDKARKRLINDFIMPSPSSKILDIGCGPGSILEHLPSGIDYYGFDMNPYYIDYAKAKYKGKGKFFNKKVTEALIKETDSFDIVLALGVIHHLNDCESRKLFELARSGLKPGGSLLTVDNVYIDGQSMVARFIISQDRGKHIRTPDGYMVLTKSYFNEIDTTIIHDMLRVPYTHFVMKCFR